MQEARKYLRKERTSKREDGGTYWMCEHAQCTVLYLCGDFFFKRIDPHRSIYLNA